MKNRFALIFTLVLCVHLNSQELPKIIPPSPNAGAFHVYGNTQVNYYTGSANITIPLFDVKEGELSLPIYLKYTGGNGLKVEEIASWVGLGWTLNAGGAISRTIRGIADEDETKKGFFKMTEIPVPEFDNFAIFDQIESGMADGEPDKFMYNYPGGSGSFFYNYDKSIYYKPMKHIKVTHNIGVESESISPVHCSTYDEVITDFTLTDEYGKLFTFKDKERSNTITYGYPYTDNRAFPSTWYLSKMENASKTDSINFEYDTYGYTLKRSRSSLVIGLGEEDIYTETSYIGKQLNKIMFTQGSVEFVASSDYRKDLSNNKYLEKIVVRDNNNNNIIKTIKFSYKYMTPSGLVDLGTVLSDNGENRLILTSVEECDGNDNCQPPTIFTYENTHYLPSRFSKAQDHWGYYNGENSNTKFEPLHSLTWYNPSISEWVTDQVGSANRSPNITYSTAGVLKEIKYPTGGKTVFDYESHTAQNDELPRKLFPQRIDLFWTNQKILFEVKLYSDVNSVSKLSVQGLYSDPDTQCKPIIYIKNLTTNAIHILSLDGIEYPQEVSLEKGNYEAKFQLKSLIVNECIQNDPALISLSWDNEEDSPNVLVGGLRVKSISDYLENNLLATKKNFNYNDDNNATSGRVVNIPKYYGLLYIRPYIGSWTPVGYRRFVNSTTPLATTQGSNAGYGKVSLSYENELSGKEEFYYTTSEDYPDSYNAINPSNGEVNYQIFDGVKIYPYPPPEVDSKDFLRGVIKKQISYKKNGDTFTKIYEKSYSYDSLKYSAGDFASFDDYIQLAAKMVRGLKVLNYDGGGSDFTYYDIYSGYTLPTQTVEKNYYSSGTVTTTTSQKYLKDPIYNSIVTSFLSRETESINSQGLTMLSKVYFPEDKLLLSGLSTEMSTSIDKILVQHRLATPLQSESYKNGILLNTQRTNYKDWGNDHILPEAIQTVKGEITATNPLEDRIILHSYYDNGNVREVSKADGTSIVYIWGYNQMIPIAKIENTIYADVQSQVANIQSKSDLDNDTCMDSGSCDEKNLRTALNGLRTSLPNALVTTYTYDPLIGITSMTDFKGYTVYYEYDNFNRLLRIKDAEGKIMSESKYHYKQ